MNFETYKAEFDKSFSKVSPNDFVSKMERLGYEFESTNYSKSIELIQFNKLVDINIQKIKGRKIFSSFCSKLFLTKKNQINWKLPSTLINTFEKGLTIEDLNSEQKSIDFNHFKFQQLLSEEKHFKIEEPRNKFTVLITENLVQEFNIEDEPNNKAA